MMQLNLELWSKNKKNIQEQMLLFTKTIDSQRADQSKKAIRKEQLF